MELLGDLAKQGAKSHWFIETTGKILPILFRSLVDPEWLNAVFGWFIHNEKYTFYMNRQSLSPKITCSVADSFSADKH